MLATKVRNLCLGSLCLLARLMRREGKLFLLVIVGIGFCIAGAAQNPTPASGAAATPAAEVALPHGQIEYLWPGGAPGAVGTEEQDKPHLEIFGASGPGAHTAVIVCPGGGYTHLAYEKEGTRIAEWLNLRGITAFVLTYRLAPRYSIPRRFLTGTGQCGGCASHAKDFNIAADRIGVWGFSAGGHMVGMLGTHFDDGDAQAADPIDHLSDRPDFVVSSYGALTLQEGVAKTTALEPLVGGR